MKLVHAYVFDLFIENYNYKLFRRRRVVFVGADSANLSGALTNAPRLVTPDQIVPPALGNPDAVFGVRTLR